ncbi:MAG: NAD(P)/FAD-dependent oxidoreductase [Mycobacteriales bacterium]
MGSEQRRSAASRPPARGGDRDSVAVIGSGVAGLTAAYLLQRTHDVTLFESDDRLGGHADTHDVAGSGGRTLPLDTGFIVHKERTCSQWFKLFAELGVATRDSEMSMSVRCDGCGLEYAGARGISGLTASPRHLARLDYLRLLAEVTRFHRQARRVLDSTDCDGLSLGGFLDLGGYSRYFVSHFALPFVAAVWSSGLGAVRRYPARYLFEFMSRHGALAVRGAPTWRTVEGGSRSYVERAAKGLTAVTTSTPIRAVHRTGGVVEVHDDADDVRRFDRVVIAAHADQALGMLADPTAEERTVLGSFGYSSNAATFHTDASILPRHPRARASWNYLKDACEPADEKVHVSYDLNRLHQESEPLDHVLTLNDDARLIDPSTVIAGMVYEHPIYTAESVAAQRRLPALSTGATAYAGAYHGWGFHEDGCASGARAAAAFGVSW